MPRGGKRKGAGAPKGNANALKHGGRARVLYGISLDHKLTRFQYRAICMEQLEHLKQHDIEVGCGLSKTYYLHKRRYRGAVVFNEWGMFRPAKSGFKF